MKKKAAIVLGAVLLVVVVLVVVWTTSVDSAVEMAIEYYGSEALGTPVTVDSVEIRTAQGKGTIRGLRVAQPDGYGTGDAIAVAEIVLDLDTGSLVDGDPYVVSLVSFTGPEVAYVMAEDGSSNLKALQANLADAEEAEESPAAGATAETPVRLRIDRLEIADGRIEADMTALGIGTANATLPPITMTHVGGRAGAPPEELAASIGTNLVGHVLHAVATSTIGRRVQQLFDKDAKGVRSMLDSLFHR